MENNPVAPTAENPAASVANPTNSNNAQAPFATPPANGNTSVNSASGTSQTQMAEPTPEQMAEYAAKFFGTTPEKIMKVKTHADNNKGFDNVFLERKREMSAPKSQSVQTAGLNQGVASTQEPAPQQVNTAPQIKGGMTADDIIAKAYFKDLASEKEFANISAEIKDGTIFDEMKKLGINPVTNGVYDDIKIRNFLGMYSKTKPAVSTSMPLTNTPTVEPTPTALEGPINDMQTALKVVQENNALVAAGKAEHPNLKEAKAFLNSGFASRHRARHDFTPWQGKKNAQQQ